MSRTQVAASVATVALTARVEAALACNFEVEKK